MNIKTGSSIGKKWFFLLAAFSLISSTLAMPIALATFSASNAKPWPTKNHVNPVEAKIAEFRAKEMTDAQITDELRKLGMGWDPKSGATGMIGESPSPEELKGLPSTKSMPATSSSRSTIEKAVAFATPTWDYTGIGHYMYPGSMPVDDDETHTHYITTHLGRPAPYYEWTEIGVAAWNTSAYVWYFTYDSDEQIDGSNWDFHGIKTNLNAADAYAIVLNGTYDSSFGGYWYDIYLNNNWKRNGHLIARGNEANDANEIFSDTGDYTADSGCKFHDNYLCDYYYNWDNWDASISYTIYENSAGYMDWDVWIDEGRYDFESWTE